MPVGYRQIAEVGVCAMSEPARPLEPAEPTLFHRLAEWLGTGRLESDRDLVRLVQDRLPTATVDRLMQQGLTTEEVHRLVIPRRTLSHRRAAAEPLTIEESDRAVRFARILALAESVFGDRDRALRWLREPKVRFGERTPLDLLDTEVGGRVVEQMLHQIDHGIFA